MLLKMLLIRWGASMCRVDGQFADEDMEVQEHILTGQLED